MDNTPKIQLNDHEKNLLHAHYLKEETELSTQIAELNEKLAEVRTRISLLFGRAHYDASWTIIQKAEYALRVANRLLTTSEIADLIIKYEGGAKIEGLVNKLSATLKQKIDAGQTVSRAEGKDGLLRYGLIEWFDKNGIPKPQYVKEAANSSLPK